MASRRQSPTDVDVVESAEEDLPLKIHINRGGSISTTRKSGLRSDDVARGFEKGAFYALKRRLSLVQGVLTDKGLWQLHGWSAEESTITIVEPDINDCTYLWYRGEHRLDSQLLEHVRPGTVYIERTTNRLLFIGPTTVKNGKCEVLADWDVSIDLGEMLGVDQLALYQLGAPTKVESQFDPPLD